MTFFTELMVLNAILIGLIILAYVKEWKATVWFLAILLLGTNCFFAVYFASELGALLSLITIYVGGIVLIRMAFAKGHKVLAVLLILLLVALSVFILMLIMLALAIGHILNDAFHALFDSPPVDVIMHY